MQTPIICSLAITTMFALVPMAICLCHLKSNPVCCVDQINVRKRLEMNGSGYLLSLHLYQFDLTHLVDVTWPDTQRARADDGSQNERNESSSTFQNLFQHVR